MKVLLSAYACEPGKGSEPEIGWQWAVHLAQMCDVTVITRANNREAIEEAFKFLEVPNLNFIYFDLSRPFRLLKSKLRPRSLGVMIYYALWQRRARMKISKLLKVEQYDVLHHSTFGAFRLSFAVSGHGVPCVVGPVGGCENFPPELFPDDCYRIRIKEGFRNFLNWLCTRWGVGMSRYTNVDSVLACTKDMHKLFLSRGMNSTLMPNIGMLAPKDQAVSQVRGHDGGFKLLFVGRIYYWKGLELAIEAMMYLPDHVSLTIVGDGPDFGDLKKLIVRKDIAHRVDLVGKRSRSEVMNMYKDSDLFFFPSLHDSGGFVVLEAMASGMPVVCLESGGPAISVTSDCGRIIELGSKDQTCLRLAEAVKHYLNNPDELQRHGLKAQERIKEVYSWERKAEQMVEIYRDLLD